MSTPPAHRVVIVGAGFGGLFAAKFLRRTNVAVTIVDRENHHLFQPLLYQVATGILSPGQIAPPIREVLRRHRNTRVEFAEVTAIDVDRRQLSAIRPDRRPVTVPYDSLIVAAGASQAYFGHDTWSRFAPGMKTIDDALELRGRIFGAFEMAELEDDPDARDAWLTFVVVGGGPTGVEMSGQIAELAHRVLRGNFRSIDPANARILVFDGGKEILASFGDRLSGKAAKELTGLGVEIHPGSVVTAVDADGVEVKRADGTTQRVPSRTKIWAAGVQASPLAGLLAEATGAGRDRAGRIQVLPDCTLPGHPEIFAIGDMMGLDELPGVAEVAMQQGIHAARTIGRRLKGDAATTPFRYHDLGSMAAISRFRAIVIFKGIRLSGFLGWLMWLVVHITFLTGFRGRLSALMTWTWTFVGRGRRERVITRQQVFGRMIRLWVEEEGGRPWPAPAHSGTRPTSATDPASRA